MTLQGMISIGILARRSGVQAETIRYYESEGLLPKPERTAGGYRLYGTSDIERLSFIRQARELGFKVASVRRLLSLADRKVDTCDEVRELATAHLGEVRTKLADLRRMERVLSCVDAPVGARDLLNGSGDDRVQSCVRPRSAAFHTPRAGMEIRRPGAIQICEREAR